MRKVIEVAKAEIELGREQQGAIQASTLYLRAIAETNIVIAELLMNNGMG